MNVPARYSSGVTAWPGTSVVIYHDGFRTRAITDRNGTFVCVCCGEGVPWIVW